MNFRLILAATLAALLSACATSPYGSNNQGRNYGGSYDSQRSYSGNQGGYCQSCGRIERIEQVRGGGGGSTSGAGAVLGAVVGGVLGNTVGRGDGRRAATVVGAVAGGVIGNEVERGQGGARGESYFEVFVRMDNGERIITRQYGIGGLREGSRVEVRGDAAYPI